MQCASARAPEGEPCHLQIPLAQIFQAYKAVLPQHGITAAEDTYYYRQLIALSLRPEGSWWAKLDAERQRAEACSRAALPPCRAASQPQHSPAVQQSEEPAQDLAENSQVHRGVPHGGGVAAASAGHSVPSMGAPALAEGVQSDPGRRHQPEFTQPSEPAAQRHERNGRLAYSPNEEPDKFYERDADGAAGSCQDTAAGWEIAARHASHQNKFQHQVLHRGERTGLGPTEDHWQEVADSFLDGRHAKQNRSSRVSPVEIEACLRMPMQQGGHAQQPAGSSHSVTSPGVQSASRGTGLQRSLSLSSGQSRAQPHRDQHGTEPMLSYAQQVTDICHAILPSCKEDSLEIPPTLPCSCLILAVSGIRYGSFDQAAEHKAMLQIICYSLSFYSAGAGGL